LAAACGGLGGLRAFPDGATTSAETPRQPTCGEGASGRAEGYFLVRKAARRVHDSIFLNLPVKDLKRSVDFFSRLGYKFNPQFTDENATCMILGGNLYAMLLVEKYFASFTPGKPVADAKKQSEVLVALPSRSREDVDRLVDAALAAGARRYREPQDHGFMYAWGFEDLDGHVWEHFWMDPKAAPAREG
jgi:uncharacterized protein